eukprot:9125524-Alexandrium_andersonii.AAC.1
MASTGYFPSWEAVCKAQHPAKGLGTNELLTQTASWWSDSEHRSERYRKASCWRAKPEQAARRGNLRALRLRASKR